MSAKTFEEWWDSDSKFDDDTVGKGGVRACCVKAWNASRAALLADDPDVAGLVKWLRPSPFSDDHAAADALLSQAARIKALEEENAKLKAELAAAKAERDALRGFVAAVFEESGWPNGGDIDGFAFQDAAIAAGLLTGETRTVPCGESCHCAEYHGDISEGVTCYRKAPWLLAAAINAARAK